MIFKFFGVQVKVHFLFTAVISLLLCVDRHNVVVYSLLSVAIHEAGHLAVMLLCGSKPRQIALCPCGVLIDCDDYSLGLKQKILIAAGGPAFNLLPALFMSGSVFKTAMLVNGFFNLLPVVCTDGGDIVEYICQIINNEIISKTIKIIANMLFIVTLSVFGILLFIKSFNPTLLAAAIYTFIMFLSAIKN